MSSSNAPKFNENDIRPDDIMVKQREFMLADIDYLLQFRDEYVHVNCPACDKNTFKVMFQKYTLDYHECENCRTIYINPRPTDAHLAKFYANSQNYDFWNKYIFPATDEVRREKIFKPRAEKVLEICKSVGLEPKTLVEVGSGFGTFCQEIKRLGFVKNIIAVEPSKGLAETCRQKGLNVIESPIEQANFEDGSADIVCSFEVIEHLHSPSDFIEKCSRVIRKGGLAIITNPNGRGFDVVVAPEHSGTVDVEHLNYMNPDSMRVLFERHGFEVLEVITPGRLDADLVRKMFLSGKMTKEENPFLYQILIEKWDEVGESFQNFLADNNLSSHMWTIARKL